MPITEGSGDQDHPDLRGYVPGSGQPGGGLRRSSDVSGESGPAEPDPRSASADTLMAGNHPEEDAVDQRAEPSAWFGNGSAPRSAEPQSPQVRTGTQADGADASPAEHAPSRSPQAGVGPDGLGGSYPGGAAQARGTSYAGVAGPATPYQASGGMPGPQQASGTVGAPGAPMTAGDDGLSQYQRPPAPPYPAQLPPPPPTTGVAAKVTAQLAALTKPRPKPTMPPQPQRPTPTTHSPRVTVASRPAARSTAPTRRAQLVLSRIEPWSVMKFSFLVSLVGWVVLFVAVAALYYVLSKLGVFSSIQSTISNVTSSKGSSGADSGGQWFSFSRVIGYTMLIGAINVVLITALATVGAVIYNLVTHLAGGIEVTLKESD
jgi:hypothetical protein